MKIQWHSLCVMVLWKLLNTCRLLTTKSRSAREALGSQLSWVAVCPVYLVDELVLVFYLCPLIIKLMVVLLRFLWDGECGFSTVGIGAILGNECGIQG